MEMFWGGFASGVAVSAVAACFGLWMGLRRYAKDFNEIVESIQDEGASK